MIKSLMGMLKISLKNSSIVFDGDSMTLGQQTDPTKSYPELTMKNFKDSNIYYNVGVAGDTIEDRLFWAEDVVDVKYNASKEYNICIIYAGLNDIYESRTNVDIYEDLKTYWSGRREKGFKVIAVTLHDAFTVDWTTSQSLTQLILSDPSLYDDVILLHTNQYIGVENAYLDLTYFKTDKVHWNEEGNKVMAGLAANTINNITN